MFPKIKRVKDPVAIEAARKPRSEISGEPTYRSAPHHIISVGSGGPDHPFNLLQTTALEHIQIHSGLYSRDELFQIVAEREGLTVEFVMSEVNRMRLEGNNAEL